MIVGITASQIKALRDATGAGFLDCRKALLAHNGDFAKAVAELHAQGVATAARKAARVANEGIIEVYQHHTGSIAVMVEVNCETDFVARNEHFTRFARELALHIANDAPRYVQRADIPQHEIDTERARLHQKTLDEGKQGAIVEKIVDGRMEKWFRKVVLLEQPWLHDDSLTVAEVVTRLVAELRENVVIRRFVNFTLTPPPETDEAE